MFGDAFRGRGGQSRKGADAVAEVSVAFVAAIQGANVKVRVPGVAEGVTVRVPPGAGNGDKVRVAGHGSPGAGGRAGDLVLTIRVEPHEFFERDGLDLKLTLPISVGEAYRGSKVRVPTPDGDVTLTVPAGVTSGKAVRLRGRGVKRQDKVGDLYVTLMVQLPSAGSPKVDQAIDVVAEATDLSARDAIKF
jgi:curved DNA-binding protein